MRGRNVSKEMDHYQAAAIPDWWAAVPPGERALIHAMARMLRGAKRSRFPEVAQAAAKWESRIGCFIKVRLVNEGRKAQRRRLRAVSAALGPGVGRSKEAEA